jgi:ABC-2 type transport system ATP-binding protein
MISVEHLVRKFGARMAVNDITFNVERGTVLGFLGPNGAGKTTTIRMIAGYLQPTSGRVSVNGIDVAANPVAAQQYMGYMPENTPLYDDMTVQHFLAFVAEIRGFSGRERNRRVDSVIETCMLQPVRHQSIDTLSKGYRQRTGLAQALIHDPEILLLDEPTEGLDPNQKQVVREMINNMARDKIIMLSTHVLEEVEAVCSRVMIISEGVIKADSTPEDLRRRSALYNTLTIEVLAPAEKAIKAFGRIGDVERVEEVTRGEKKQVLRLYPKNNQPLTVSATETAAQHKWLITDIHVHPGRLDEVFRQITTTDDVMRKSA